MKKYTDYYSTPLKFHKFFHYVWTPITLIVSIIALFSSIGSYSQFNRVTAVITTFALLNTGLIVAYFLGFLRWKKYGWYCLYIQMAEELIYGVFQYFVYSTYLPALKSMAFGIIFGVILRGVPIGIYYYNRRALFTAEGFNPKQPPAVIPQQTTFDTYCVNIKLCPNCGKEVQTDNLFCIHCGVSVAGVKVVEKTAETAENMSEIPEITAENPPNTEMAQSVKEEKQKDKISKGKISAKMLTACALAAVFAVLNVVQLVSASNLRADNQRLSAKVNQLEETVQDYSHQLSEALEISQEEREMRDKANRYDTITNFVLGQSRQNKSKKYYPSTYLVVMSLEDGQQNFEITANFEDVTVRFKTEGEAVEAKFAQNWNGTSIDVELTPNYKGTTKLVFTNDVNSDSFTVLVVVV